jgi:hypothetical protein
LRVADAEKPGKVQVGVVEEIVEFGAEFDLQAFDWGGELLVDREVSLVEGRSAARIPERGCRPTQPRSF